MMKKLFKRAAAVVMTMALMFGLSACSGASAADLMEEAVKNMNDIKSMSFEMNMDIEMSAMGQSIAMKTTTDADCIADPMLMKMDINMDMGAAGSMKSKMYMEAKDGKYIIYTGMETDGKTTWQKKEQQDAKIMQQYDAKASFDMYMKNANSFKENGTEEINGKNAARYDGVISNDSISEVIDSSGLLNQLSSIGISADNLSEILKDCGDLNVSIWLDDDSMPVKYEINMTKMMQSIMKSALKGQEGSEDITIGKTIISAAIKDVNNVETFEIPQDVIDSAESVQ